MKSLQCLLKIMFKSPFKKYSKMFPLKAINKHFWHHICFHINFYDVECSDTFLNLNMNYVQNKHGKIKASML